MTAPQGSLTIVGLGPGSPALLTVEARDALSAAGEVWLRTARHPTVSGLPAGPLYESFDGLYEAAESFDRVYAAIVGRVMELARRPQGCLYAVPGHPLSGEATVSALLSRCPEAGIPCRIVPGLSFVDAALVAVGHDALADGLLVLDALSLGSHGRDLVPTRPTLIAQVYDRRAASAVKLALLEAYPPEHEVMVVSAPGGGSDRVGACPLADLDREDRFDHITSVFVPALDPIEAVRSFEGLRAVVARLRDPVNGCPWDLEQTHESLKRYLLEEAYEALDALESGDPHRLTEELGDLMMQVVLHAQLAEDAGDFVIEDVVAGIATKLIRRHPHVFGDLQVEGAGEVLANWEKLKREERADVPVLDHVPRTMPALMQAQAVQSRAEKAGLGRPTSEAPGAALLDPSDPDEFGEALFALAAVARSRGIDAEEALRGAIERFRAEAGARERR